MALAALIAATTTIAALAILGPRAEPIRVKVRDRRR